jgi:hypothetical protein
MTAASIGVTRPESEAARGVRISGIRAPDEVDACGGAPGMGVDITASNR